MRYIRQHISTIIATYDGALPLAHFLKNYFKENPILGSRDRKMLTTLAYTWYRCSNGMANREWFDGLIAQWLKEPDKFQNFSLPVWLDENSSEFSLEPYKLFQYNIPFSEGIGKDEWLYSMLAQPDLFIRVRREKPEISRLLNEKQVAHTFITDTCVALPNSTKLEGILPADSYVVQDASSQQTGKFFHPQKQEAWYDCCCGAGGKALLLKDMQPDINLTVSDKRESIYMNLMKRFRQYYHSFPKAHIVDVSNKNRLSRALGDARFDNIICDAPCTGSGTWARTPEQLYFFHPASLEKYTDVQKKIAINVTQYLKPGGRIFYITCSVFKRENEDVVNEITSQLPLRLVECDLINGISIKADSMFIAVLERTAN